MEAKEVLNNPTSVVDDIDMDEEFEDIFDQGLASMTED